MTDQAEATEAAPSHLKDEIRELLKISNPLAGTEDQLASSIMHLLNERGHYLPGCPPAAQIRKDAEQFAGQFMLALLCVRLLRMDGTGIITPETKPMRKWLHDYIDGKNHGPIGQPMFWPSGMKGLADQLRQWGYGPTPTNPPYVARAPRPIGVLN